MKIENVNNTETDETSFSGWLLGTNIEKIKKVLGEPNIKVTGSKSDVMFGIKINGKTITVFNRTNSTEWHIGSKLFNFRIPNVAVVKENIKIEAEFLATKLNATYIHCK